MAVLYMFFLATACPPDLKIFHVHVRAARGQVTPRQLSARSALLLVVLVAFHGVVLVLGLLRPLQLDLASPGLHDECEVGLLEAPVRLPERLPPRPASRRRPCRVMARSTRSFVSRLQACATCR